MYKSLADPPAGDLKDAPDLIATRVVSKFCSFGMVASKSWSDTYLTIIDGVVRLYDSEQTCRVDPRKFVMEIPLGRGHRASTIIKKNYSKDKMQVIDFYCFYLEVDNGIPLSYPYLRILTLTNQFLSNTYSTTSSPAPQSFPPLIPSPILFAPSTCVYTRYIFCYEVN